MKKIVNMEMNNSLANFWEVCSNKTKTEIIDLLIFRLGIPKNDLDSNCLDEITRKILYFHSESKDTRTKAVSSVIGKVVEITQTEFKKGNRRVGQIYYSIKLENKKKLRAIKEDLSVEKWTQVQKLELLDQVLLFKYRKSIYGNDICDFYPVESESTSNSQSQPPEGDEGASRRVLPSQLD